MRKIYVSIDLEGLPGISGISQVAPGYPMYSDARRIMTWMSNLFAEALLSNGIDEVLISDSHGYMGNIEYMEMKEGTRILQGYPRPYSMVLGVEEADAAVFVGYHASAGTRSGFLDHTYSSRTIYEVRIDGVVASELLINALYAGDKGVPVILVAGDENLRKDVEEHIPWSVFVALKKGVTRFSAWYMDRGRIESMVWKAVRDAVEALEENRVKPLKWRYPATVDVVLRETLPADMAEMIPGAQRIDGYTVEYKARDGTDLLRFVELVAWIGGAGYSLIQGMRG